MRYKSIWYTGIVLAASGPLGLWSPDLHPPWPDFSVQLAMLATAISAILGLLIGNAIERPGVRLGAGCMLLIVGLISLYGYAVVYSNAVTIEDQLVGDDARLLRFVIGDELRENVVPAESLELLRDYEYRPEAIWTRKSLTKNRINLMTSFLLTFCTFTAGIALVAVNGVRVKGQSKQSRAERSTDNH